MQKTLWQMLSASIRGRADRRKYTSKSLADIVAPAPAPFTHGGAVSSSEKNQICYNMQP